MPAEIIAVGTELTTGAKLDTNSQWLSVELAAVGIETLHHQTVADELDRMGDVLRTAIERCDLVLLTGGLGPTLDDLTREVVANAVGVELVTDDDALTTLTELFTRRGRVMAERNRIQAMFPAGAEILPNPIGTAPGFTITTDTAAGHTTRIAAFPGVPSEMRRMYRETLLPKLTGGGRVIRQARINCFGRGESDIEEQLGELTARGRQPEVGITASKATITLRITATGPTAEHCEQQIAETRAAIRDRLGILVFGEEDETLEAVIVRLLQSDESKPRTLCCAESGTGGDLANRITDVPGSTDVFLGGVVVPSRVGLERVLTIEPSVLERFGTLSAETVTAMAEAARKLFGTDYALAISETPVVPEAADVPVPQAHVALATSEGVRSVSLAMLVDPEIHNARTSKAALNLLRLELLGKT